MHLVTIVVSLVGLASLASGQLECSVLKLDEAGDSDGVCLGTALALDGATAIVASPGFVRVQRRTTNAWTDEATLSVGAYAVDLCGDTLALGNHLAFTGEEASIFTRTGTSWARATALVAADHEPGDRFGYAVAVQPDEVVVTAPWDETVHGVRAGSAYVFRNGATGWEEVQHLVPDDGEPDARFGRAVELASERLVVGSPNWQAGPGQPFTGQVYVYARSGTDWVLESRIVPSSGYVDEDFGHSLALDGDRLAVGTYTLLSFEDPLAYVFLKGAGGWLEEARFSFPTFGQYFEAGHVALAGDLLAVGENDLRLFQRTDAWQPLDALSTPADGSPFTGGLELCGNRLLQGAPDVDVQPFDATGIARIFELALPVTSYCTGKVNSLGCVPRMSWTGAPSASDPTPFRVGASEVRIDTYGILFYGLAGRSAQPFAGGTLCIARPLRRTHVQYSGSPPPPASCAGRFSFDFDAWIQGGLDPSLDPGRVVDLQYWSRDPEHVDGTGISLSNAIEATICP